jgi:hypothetical protein
LSGRADDAHPARHARRRSSASESLFIEALPGTHLLLEDFKLVHRAIDVKKVQAELRRAEMENLRLAARLAVGNYGDPDVERKIVVEGHNAPTMAMNVND